MKHKLLAANRGEIACRVLAAARSLGLPTVAVHSDADAGLPHVDMADEAVRIGPAPARESYLDGAAIIEAALATGSTLVHPGYGFLSENAAFAEACAQAGLAFVGPAPEHIRLMGDKESARACAIAAGVPVLPGTERLPGDPQAVLEAGRAVGYPLLVKAVAGGGGHGMQRVDDEDRLLAAVERTRGFAARIFHDDGVYLERFLVRARHVEVQVFGFGAAGAVHLFERDCSLQRRHQKVVEEAPAPGLSAQTRARMTAVSTDLAAAIGYRGAGTVEYLFDPDSQAFYFLEMNTRIQVEHPVTEMVTGVDLVSAQIRQAMGEDLSAALAQPGIALTGASVEARLYAENPDKRFLPSPGPLASFVLPAMPGVRVDAGYREGNEIGTHYDPLIAKLIAHADTREQALDRLVAALRATQIAGIVTNRDYLVRLLDSRSVRQARAHTRTIEEGIEAG
ncbi:acetyl-CoA carboxylase biotin carboxylase subunit [Aquibium sp. A9E412]|uniref:acetyl-CoA carboxylase biotin carboxylase subunit n=1 Tax=Aquibium sp. A9E412 TaxID=2976767 RepID=UPI0025B1E1DD|nr:biotin carboxylase N-terminal domain-containing protein [Aquibium sp. A9E412]MDN2566719.1 acetyl-CoA carboxylase biotin carboxylase subunit [Aquibium sp. A9E412]